jgi:hypothetical protein
MSDALPRTGSRAVLMLLALLAGPGIVAAQGVPLGPEFRVNSYTASDQWFSAIASDSAGNFVVVWNSASQDGSQLGIFAQRYASTGSPLGGEFRVNTYTTADQFAPDVGSDPAGNLVVVWTSYQGGGRGVFGQRFASTGAPLGPEFRVDTYTAGFPTGGSVAVDSAGNFVVAWQSFAQDGDLEGIYAQRFAGNGAPLGGEFRVNTYTTSVQLGPSIASDPGGSFVVAWTSPDSADIGVFAQRYASTGAPLGGEFRVHTYTTGHQLRPSVAADSAGNFIVAWQSALQDDGGRGVFAQRYASNGTPMGPEFRVNSYTTGSQGYPSVASDQAGNFVVTWSSYDQDGAMWGIFCQRYAGNGAALGGEFRVNTYTSSDQVFPSVAADPAGDFVVSWLSRVQDGDGDGIFAQRYSTIIPVELQSFRIE